MQLCARCQRQDCNSIEGATITAHCNRRRGAVRDATPNTLPGEQPGRLLYAYCSRAAIVAASNRIAVVALMARAQLPVGEGARDANLLKADVSASRRVWLHTQIPRVASTVSLVGGYCIASGSSRLTDERFGTDASRPHRQ